MYYPVLMLRFLHRRRPRSLLWGTMLVIVLGRGLIPAGLMLGEDAAGALTLTLCPGATHAAAAGGAAGNHHAPKADAARWDSPCLFAVSAIAAPPPQAFWADSLFVRLVGVVALPDIPSSAIPSILRAQSPRAPPTPV
jgi:hypothetical protein